MATICSAIFKHHLKTDGSYNVKIRIYHKKEKRYIDTIHFVSGKQLTKDLSIKDPFINRQLNKQIDDYRIAISELGGRLDFFSADALKDYLLNKNEEINFIKFCDDHIDQLKKDNRRGTAANHTAVRNSLLDYFKRDKVSILEITVSMLRAFEKFLRSERKITRINQLNRAVTTESKGVSDSGLYNYMRDLRTLFNAAREKYNDEDLGIVRVPHYPFAKYKVGTPPQTAKRNIPLTLLKAIRDYPAAKNGRDELARDLFMLSFYMCGINAVDLFNCTEKNIRYGRLEYNRAKTKGRRKDNAFISIKIIKEAKPLLEKYLGKLSARYATCKEFNAALSKGMSQIAKSVKFHGITFYWARHTFANVARNECRISKDDIGLALNHIDHGHKTTDIYISIDWKIVDDVQSNVVNQIRNLEKNKS